ncbi:MAG: coproporphyrinogen III oxidase, partial [Phaeodactylibacter sp.]|nr:coproporphyrinogen III oxidase [Phaeodactylibacter sp.]
RASLEHALSAGFTGLTIDLIYGAPTTGQKQWEENIDIFFGYGIPHLSSYALTVEDRTALAHFIKTGKVPPVEDEKAARQYEYLMASMHAGGYVQYEISNFARPGCFAVHNSSYWKGEPYLGLGPSAHSYNGASRQWNISNNAGYIRLLQGSSGAQALIPGLFETEHLSTATRYNEYVMTGLRTIWGVELFHLRQMAPAYENYFLENIRPFLDAGQAKQEGDTISLTDAGRLLADGIASAVFMVGETGPEFRM